MLVCAVLLASACNSEPAVDTSAVERIRYETVRIANEQPTVVVTRGWPPTNGVAEWDRATEEVRLAVLQWLATHVDAAPFRTALDCRGFGANEDISGVNKLRAVDALRDAQMLQLTTRAGTLLQSVDDFFAANPDLDPETAEFVNRAGGIEDDLSPEACAALADWVAFVSAAEPDVYIEQLPAAATLTALREIAASS